LITQGIGRCIFAQANYRVFSFTIGGGDPAQADPSFVWHINSLIQQELTLQGFFSSPGLVAGHKKDVIIHNQCADPQHRQYLCYFGWYRPDGTTWEKGGCLNIHESSYHDYSHGTRFLLEDIEVTYPGPVSSVQTLKYYDALKDPLLGKILNHDTFPIGPFDGKKCWNTDAGSHPLPWFTKLKNTYPGAYWPTEAELASQPTASTQGVGTDAASTGDSQSQSVQTANVDNGDGDTGDTDGSSPTNDVPVNQVSSVQPDNGGSSVNTDNNDGSTVNTDGGTVNDVSSVNADNGGSTVNDGSNPGDQDQASASSSTAAADASQESN